MNYLIKMKPLEPYAFGTERTFKFEGVKSKGNETYFIKSNDMPEQTTVFGMLRYFILMNEGILKENFKYTDADRENMSKLIGPDSFSFAKEEQTFGIINGISPVFLIDDKNHYYVKNPFHNKSKCGFEAMKLSENIIITSEGKIRLPAKGEYNSKDGHAKGYFDLMEGKVVDKLFDSFMLTGNRKNREDESDEEGFFKREVKCLKDSNMSFAVFADISGELPDEGICYMGQKKTPFLIETSIKEDDLDEHIKKAFYSEETWTYALSDLVLQSKMTLNNFSIIEEKDIRNLETCYDEKTAYINKLRRSEKQYNLVRAGSVFFGDCLFDLSNENHKKLGYNRIVTIGGR